jgi:hypothetical protein
MKVAVAFLTVNPQENTIKFAQQVGYRLGYDVFIVVDDNTCALDVEDLHIIQINDNSTKQYINSNINSDSTHIKKNPIAMDKFLFAFCENYLEYDFVWVFEDDVFIQSIDSIKHLHDNYGHFDLVVPNHFIKKDKIPDWHWRSIFSLFPNREEPFYYSMVCAMGVSRNMLNAIKDYAYKNESLFYIEVMFNTLAEDNNLKVVDAFELKSIVWKGNWDVDEFLLLPNNVFHPRKDIDNHYNLREKCLGLHLSGYKPKDNLPNFIKDLLE